MARELVEAGGERGGESEGEDGDMEIYKWLQLDSSGDEL